MEREREKERELVVNEAKKSRVKKKPFESQEELRRKL